MKAGRLQDNRFQSTLVATCKVDERVYQALSDVHETGKVSSHDGTLIFKRNRRDVI